MTDAARIRALCEEVLDDPGASHADRLGAIVRLQELDREERAAGAAERPSPDEALREAESLHAAAPGILHAARVEAGEADAWDVKAPADPTDPGPDPLTARLQEEMQRSEQERLELLRIGRAAFEELFDSDNEPDCERVKGAWRRFHPPDAEAEDEPKELPGGDD